MAENCIPDYALSDVLGESFAGVSSQEAPIAVGRSADESKSQLTLG